MSDLKITPFYEKHLDLGARMVGFGGWNMPVQYRGILEEHSHTRKCVSIFDCSHMGQFRVSGARVAETLDRMFPRAVVDQPVGVCRYNFLVNEEGGVIDDLILYRVADEEFFIVVNAGTKDGDAEWFKAQLAGKADFIDESAQTAKLDLQGPKVKKLLPRLGLDPAEIPGYFRFIQTRVADIDMIVSQTGYTGERGLELYFDASEADRIWDLLLSLDNNLQPAGLGARDTLRLEMGYPLYGHEMDTQTTPVEAGFKKMLNLEGREFIGREQMLKKRRKKLIGIVFDSRRAAREGSEIFNQAGEAIGTITSGSFAPSLGTAVAMGFVRLNTVMRGDTVTAKVGRSELTGKVVKMPFYKHGTAGK